MESRKRMILVVERNRRNRELLVDFLERQGYGATGVDGAEEIDRILDAGPAPDLALIDLAGFDRSIWESCERMRRSAVPFLIISPQQSTAIRQDSISRGASGVLVKPLATRELAGLIRHLLEA